MPATASIDSRARRLHDARLTRAPVPQSDRLELDDAYRVQRAGIELRKGEGERLVGAKMGFTSRAKMQQMGVAEMIVGQLTDAMQVEDGGVFQRRSAIHPRVEPEIAFLLGSAIDAETLPTELNQAVAAVACAMEIIDSRYQDFRFSLADVVADNTSACGFVLGAWQPVRGWFDNLGIAMRFDGRPVQLGSSAAILGSPWRALVAARQLAVRHGIALPAGSVILAGAATAAEPLPESGHVEAEVAGLGRVSFHIEPAKALP